MHNHLKAITNKQPCSLLKAQRKRRTQSGNVFFLVILGVALFAALGFTFSRGARTGTDRISDKRAELAVQDILTYAQQLTRGTNRVISRGISESDISFENDFVTTGYTNANCTDDECRIFKPDGGAINYREPDADWLDSIHSAKTAYGEWRITMTGCIEGLADGTCSDSITSDDELAVILPYLKQSICSKINKKLNISDSVMPVEPNRGFADSLEQYDGALPADDATLDDTGTNLLAGKSSGCFVSTTGTLQDSYTFYQVLIER